MNISDVQLVVNLLFLQGVDEHAAGGEDVFTAGTADSTGNAVSGQIVAEGNHPLLIAGREVCL